MSEISESVVVYEVVYNERASRQAQKRQAATGERQQWPGWLVFGLFMLTAEGDPTCVDYRVRAIPDLRDMTSWADLAVKIGDSMTGVGQSQPALVPLPGGIPRYVFEKASQAKLLQDARRKIERGGMIEPVSGGVRAILTAGTDVKPGRPPARSLREKLIILERVESAFRDGTSLSEVADESLMSRSSLRDLLSWARHDASPRLFTNLGAGQRKGELTPEARLLLNELDIRDSGRNS